MKIARPLSSKKFLEKLGDPGRGSEFLLEEIEGHLADNSFLPGIDDADCDPKGDLLLLEKYLKNDPISSLPPKEQKFKEL
ncbi:hypothetical protein Tco_0406119, partial [Tanacetum coccineum]